MEAAKWMATLKLDDEPSEETSVRLEKELLISFYSIRKIIYEHKVSDSSKKIPFSLKYFPIKEEAPTPYNYHRIDYIYDFENEFSKTKGHLVPMQPNGAQLHFCN